MENQETMNNQTMGIPSVTFTPIGKNVDYDELDNVAKDIMEAAGKSMTDFLKHNPGKGLEVMWDTILDMDDLTVYYELYKITGEFDTNGHESDYKLIAQDEVKLENIKDFRLPAKKYWKHYKSNKFSI